MLKFRSAVPKDFAEICRLITTEDELFLVYPNGKFPFTVEQVKELSVIRHELTVAVENGEIIGFANFYDYEPNKFAFIGNVVIEKNRRGRGLGKEIVKHMLEKAYGKFALPEVRISVFSDNTPALLLYSSLDFLPYEIEERTTPLGGRAALIHLKRSAL